MKKILVITILISSFNGITQNIEYSKEFKSDLNCKEYSDEDHLAIHYYKCFEDKILKYHDSQLQLLSEEAEVLWEKSIQGLKNFNNDVNRFQVTYDNEFIYLAQAGQASLPYKIPVKVLKISEDGDIIEKDFTGTIPARKLSAFEIVNETLILAYSGVYSGTQPDWNQTFVVLDADLEIVKGPVNLSIKSDGQKNESFQHFWHYAGVINDKLTFHTYYFNTDGKYSNFGNPLQEKWIKKAMVNENLEMEYSRPSKIVLGSQTKTLYPNQLAYDTAVYKVLVRPIEVEHDELMEFTDPNPFFLYQPFNEVYVETKKRRSQNLAHQFLELLGKKISDKSGIIIIDVLDDPINESISAIITQDGRTYYTFSLDSELQMTHLSSFLVEAAYDERYSDPNIGHHLKKSKAVNVSYPDGYKKNALDFVTTLGEDCFFTILNYETYQLVFTDNKKTKITKVYKITQ